jgi:hypothetical protein
LPAGLLNSSGAKGLKPMNYQHVENLLIRYRGGTAQIKTMSGENYEGTIADVTNDYVALKVKDDAGEEALKIVLLHAIESLIPQRR